MRWAGCVAWTTEEKQLNNSIWIAQRRDYLEVLDVNGKIIFKCILNSVERAEWIHSGQANIRLRAVMNTTVKI